MIRDEFHLNCNSFSSVLKWKPLSVVSLRLYGQVFEQVTSSLTDFPVYNLIRKFLVKLDLKSDSSFEAIFSRLG